MSQELVFLKDLGAISLNGNIKIHSIISMTVFLCVFPAILNGYTKIMNHYTVCRNYYNSVTQLYFSWQKGAKHPNLPVSEGGLERSLGVYLALAEIYPIDKM